MKECVITIISNILLYPYFDLSIHNIFAKENINTEIQSLSLEEYRTESANKQIKKSDYIIIWLNFEALFPDNNITIHSDISEQIIIDHVISLSHELYNYISSEVSAPLTWVLFEDYYSYNSSVVGHIPFNNNLVNRINCALYNIFRNKVQIIDLKHLIAEIGISNTYNNRNKYRWNAPYTNRLISIVAEEVNKQYLIKIGKTKKCLVLDCDNVLWGGVISEDGIEKIILSNTGPGRRYKDFQKFLLFLYYHGVIIAICSKNDMSDVMTVFQEHNEMVIQEKYISCFQVNWNNKADNIQSISRILNIGLDSMVFIDDSEFELQIVKSILPDVTTILFDNDIYKKLDCFNLTNNSDYDNIFTRTETYRTNNERQKLQEACLSFEEFINLLDIRVDFHLAKKTELNRISELTQRTNKCTNGRRYTTDELNLIYANDDYELFSLFVSDKFSDLGLVGAIGIDGNVLDLFSLSCRALGRNIEEFIIEFLKNKKVQRFSWYDTGKNQELQVKLSEFFIEKVE